MPHCTKCGATVSEDASFCQNCGQPQPSVAPAAVTSTSARSGISENAAALLSYALGWITGIIFLLIDRRPSVRFHAAQSIVTFGGLHILRIVLGMPFGVGWWFGGFGHWGGFGIGVVLLSFLGLLTFILWIICMLKAYQGVRFKLPLLVTSPRISLAGESAGRADEFRNHFRPVVAQSRFCNRRPQLARSLFLWPSLNEL